MIETLIGIGMPTAAAVCAAVVRLDRHRMLREAMRDPTGGKAARLTTLLHGHDPNDPPSGDADSSTDGQGPSP